MTGRLHNTRWCTPDSGTVVNPSRRVLRGAGMMQIRKNMHPDTLLRMGPSMVRTPPPWFLAALHAGFWTRMAVQIMAFSRGRRLDSGGFRERTRGGILFGRVAKQGATRKRKNRIIPGRAGSESHGIPAEKIDTIFAFLLPVNRIRGSSSLRRLRV
jgi:hypothetical protein